MGSVSNILYTLVNKNPCEDTNNIKMKSTDTNMKYMYIETNYKKQIDIEALHWDLYNLYSILSIYKEDQVKIFCNLMNKHFSIITENNIKTIYQICSLIDRSNNNLLNLIGYKYIEI